ncbi:uncharacterized protein LOC108958704 isoform X1 [Eucalyptus grandis]|uniref:uncharacterized protein LOC108958704 isoform X1 n=1 Tax=Eucalyptus grandis TaxID=71139 RepID=UPI00192F0621|nr:uncharacterized protein LOC108958704 isoform X1 [Eucalyptus grandis]
MIIMELPNFILQLKSLEILRFPLWPFNVKEYSYYHWQFTCGISTLVNLRELDPSRRNRMKCEILVEKEDILFVGIPKTINTFHDLHILDFTDCHETQELMELPTSLTYLHLRHTSLLGLPGPSRLTNLVNLLLRDGSDYEGKSKLIPGSDLRGIVNLSRLKWVELRLLNVPANPQLSYPSQPQEIVLGHLDSKPPVQLPSSNWRWRNLSTLEIYGCEVEDISLDGLSQLENLSVSGCERLQRFSIPLELRKLWQARVKSCQDLVEIQFVDVSNSLEDLTVSGCKSPTIISGLSYLKNLERLVIHFCDVLINVEALNELESLKELSVCWCFSLRWLIDASCTKIPDDCIVHISWCGYFIKNSKYIDDSPRLKHYKKEILQNTSKKDSFTIRFHLGVKDPGERNFGSVRGIEREKKDVDPDSLTYEGLIANVKSFGFRFKRMWHETKDDYPIPREIKSDGDVNDMLDMACREGFIIHLYVEGGVDSEWEGEYDEEMMKMLREERRMKTDVYSNEDGAKGDVSCPNGDSNTAPVGGESETHGNSSADDSELGQGNAECFEATTSIAKEDLDTVKKQVELHENLEMGKQ